MIMGGSWVDQGWIVLNSPRIVPQLPGSLPNTPNRARRPVPLLRAAVGSHAARRSEHFSEDECAAQAHSVANQEFGSHGLHHPGGSDAVAGDPGSGDRVVNRRLGPRPRRLQDLHGDRLDHRWSRALLRSDASLLRGNLLLKEARLCLTATRGGGL